MSFLVRTRAGKYKLDTALTIEEIKELASSNDLASSLSPVETVFEEYNLISLGEADTFKYNNGVLVELICDKCDESTLKRVYDNKGAFLGIGELLIKGQALHLKSKKFFKKA